MEGNHGHGKEAEACARRRVTPEKRKTPPPPPSLAILTPQNQGEAATTRHYLHRGMRCRLPWRTKRSREQERVQQEEEEEVWRRSRERGRPAGYKRQLDKAGHVESLQLLVMEAEINVPPPAAVGWCRCYAVRCRVFFFRGWPEPS
jgi:hypothetical protein